MTSFDEMANYDKAIELNPNDAGAYYNRGVAYYKQGKYQQALADYDKALELNPQGATIYNDRGVIYYIQGRYQKAIV